jgi:hypothetical protein
VTLEHFDIKSCEAGRCEAWVKGTLSFGPNYSPRGGFLMSLVKEKDRWRVDSLSASHSQGL